MLLLVPMILLRAREVNMELLGHLLPTVFHLLCMALSTFLHVLSPSLSRLLGRVERSWHWPVHKTVVHSCCAAGVAPHRRQFPFPWR